MVVHSFFYTMTCEGCASAARKKLEDTYGDPEIKMEVKTTVSDQRVDVTLPEHSEVSADDLLAALREGDVNARKI